MAFLVKLNYYVNRKTATISELHWIQDYLGHQPVYNFVTKPNRKPKKKN